ncbi:MAG: hypothetical protein GX559_00660 [Candidatus Pacebacteria bacterium]|nr:hypothetical protein [Candidatus Paceibacterota bacterium]
MTKTKKAQQASVNSKETKKPSLISPNDQLRINIAWSEIEQPYQKTIRDLAKKLKVEGFRQGKVPLAIAEKQISLEKAAEIILKDILPDKYIKALKESKKQAITAPEYHLVSLKKGEDWVIDAYFCEAPQIKLKDYKNHIKTAKKAAAEFIKKHNETKPEVKTEKIEKKDGKKEEKTQSEASKTAGQAPAKLSPDQEKEIYYQHILRELVLNIRPSIGELLLRRETQAEFARFKEQLAAYQLSLEKYLAQRQITIEELSNELAGTVLNRLQIDFVLAAIARERQLKVSDQDLQKALADIQDEKLREQISAHEHYLDSFKAQLLRQQTINSLLED